MKSFISFIGICAFALALTGCGKTLGELRTNGDAMVDNATGAANGILTTVGTIAKKAISAGFAIYDIGKKVVEDTQDNAGTVTGGAIGTKPVVETPAK